MKKIAIAIIALMALACSTEKDSGPGLSAIENPREGKLISMYGETVTVTFAADAAWSAELMLNGEGEWAKISKTTGAESAGQGKVLIRFSKNETEAERTADLYVTVQGHEKELVHDPGSRRKQVSIERISQPIHAQEADRGISLERRILCPRHRHGTFI